MSLPMLFEFIKSFNNFTEEAEKSPYNYLEYFKNSDDSSSSSLTKFGSFISRMALDQHRSPSDGIDIPVLVEKNMLWAVFRFKYPDNTFLDNQSRNWLATKFDHLEVVERIHSDKNVGDFIDEEMLPPSCIVDNLIEHAPTLELHRKPWLICYKNKFDNLSRGTYNNSNLFDVIHQEFDHAFPEELKSFVVFKIDDDKVEITRLDGQHYDLQYSNLEDLLAKCGEQRVHERFRKFTDIIFTENKDNKLSNSHLICDFYLRIPIRNSSSDKFTEIYLAIKSDDIRYIIQSAFVVYFGASLIAHITDANVSDYVIKNSDIKTNFLNELAGVNEGGRAHPFYKEGGPEEIPTDTSLASELLKLEEDRAVNSFKALYHKRPENKSSDSELITISIIDELLKAMKTRMIKKINLQLTGDLSKEHQIQLPVSPGLLFFICLIDFFESINLTEPELDLSCKTLDNGEKQANLTMKKALNYPDRFKNAFETNTGGRGVKALRNLLSCNRCEGEDMARKIRLSYRDSYRELLPSKMPPTEEGGSSGSTIYKCFLEKHIDTSSGDIILSWTTNVKN